MCRFLPLCVYNESHANTVQLQDLLYITPVAVIKQKVLLIPEGRNCSVNIICSVDLGEGKTIDIACSLK